jgi:hypothetical protein
MLLSTALNLCAWIFFSVSSSLYECVLRWTKVGAWLSFICILIYFGLCIFVVSNILILFPNNHHDVSKVMFPRRRVREDS